MGLFRTMEFLCSEHPNLYSDDAMIVTIISSLQRFHITFWYHLSLHES